MRFSKRVACLAVALVIATGWAGTASYAATNLSSITSESIKEKEQQKKEAEALKKQIQSQISDAKALKKELESLKSDVANYITTLDTQLSDIQAKINELNELITAKEAEIEQITIELNEAIATEEAQYAAMKKRIQFMYERGDNFYLEIMFSAKSFGDFLTKADYIDMLEEYDKNKLEEYRATREWTQLCKDTLEAEKATLDEAKAVQESEQATLEELLKEKENELANYNSQISSKEKQISDAEAEYAEEVAVIEQLEAAILKEKKEIASSMSTIIYDGGQFCWPCPSYVRVTDEYGWRTDPISGSSSFHSGLDLGAPGGSPILAAYDGVVVSATYNWSMGNYIMIDHGDGLYTIYMHASALYVKEGDIVVAGETIAAVGTTGRSTGNHLHFGVRLNGSYVSPWNYLK